MRDFEYAAPEAETEAVALLSPEPGKTEILAGGTDLIGLMKKMIVTPNRVVDIKGVRSLHGIRPLSEGLMLGAATSLEELCDSPLLDAYPSIKQVLQGVTSLQLQCQSTLGGELCRRPRCWYFRRGHGLLAQRGRLAEEGDNRFHAVFGNGGPAKFVNASRLAPALVALGAEIRVLGPKDRERFAPLEDLYRTPRDENQRENVLEPNELLTHVRLPAADGLATAAYEVRHGEGPDDPLAAAAVCLRIEAGVVRDAKVVLGQVAPTPWISREARRVLVGQPVSQSIAEAAGDAAASVATPLKDNGYKVQLARVAVKRAVLRATGFETGGL